MNKLFTLLYWLLFITITVFVIYTIYKNSNISSSANIEKLPKVEYPKETRLAKKSVAKKPKIKKNKEIKPKALTQSLEERLSLLNANFGDRIYLQIFKKENILEVWIKPSGEKTYKLLKIYPICYFSGKLGPKLKEGDGQSPEGFYKVYKGSLNPNSSYHLSFNLGFPNRYDRVHHRTGSYLMVHGDCVSIGCYAMGDSNIEDIYKLVESHLDKHKGYVLVSSYPFRLSYENLDKYRANKWYKFWQNLKEGYDYFEKEKTPPHVKVKSKKYIFK